MALKSSRGFQCGGKAWGCAVTGPGELGTEFALWGVLIYGLCEWALSVRGFIVNKGRWQGKHQLPISPYTHGCSPPDLTGFFSVQNMDYLRGLRDPKRTYGKSQLYSIQMVWYLFFFFQTTDRNRVSRQLFEFSHKFCIWAGFTCLWYFPVVSPSTVKQPVWEWLQKGKKLYNLLEISFIIPLIKASISLLWCARCWKEKIFK